MSITNWIHWYGIIIDTNENVSTFLNWNWNCTYLIGILLYQIVVVLVYIQIRLYVIIALKFYKVLWTTPLFKIHLRAQQNCSSLKMDPLGLLKHITYLEVTWKTNINDSTPDLRGTQYKCSLSSL